MKRKRTKFPKEVSKQNNVRISNPISNAPITLRAEMYCQYYISTSGNGTVSARLAGFKGDDDQLAITSSRLLKNTKVITRIRELFNEVYGSVACKAEERIKILSDFARNNSTLKVKDPITGMTMIIPQIVPKERMRAIDILNRMEKIYDDRKSDDKGNTTVNMIKEVHMHVGELTDDTLGALLDVIKSIRTTIGTQSRIKECIPVSN